MLFNHVGELKITMSNLGETFQSDSAGVGMETSDTGALRVVFVHDWLIGMRGGEKVLDALCECFPHAPLWTLLYAPRELSKAITGRPIHTSILQHLPLAASKYRYYLPLFPLFAEFNRVKDADVVISTSHAVAKSMVKRDKRGRPIHICYMHTPMRYIWDRYEDYFGVERVGKLKSSFLYRPVVKMLQRYDVKTVSRVDMFIANSTFVANRIKRIYAREAAVLPPPVDVDRFSKAVRCAQEWYLMVTALVPYKRVDHAIKVCASLKRKLKIVGTGPDENALKALARSLGVDVEFCGFVTDDELVDYYRQARALLFPGVEDFGIAPVEAIATGCPVIALHEGGVVDTLTPSTAVLYSEPTPDALRTALLRFESMDFEDAALRSRAWEFSRDKFIRRFRALLASTLEEYGIPEAALTVEPLTNHAALALQDER